MGGAIVNDGRIDGGTLLELLRELPGGPELLVLSAAREDVELIGGAARDLLLDHVPRELDVVVDGSAEAFADQIAAMLDSRFAAEDGERCGVVLHERFGTAVVSWKGGRIDLATRRAESYAAPGALPEVRPGTPDEDLRRRDFTVNAIAVGLGGRRRGELRAVPDALEDLSNGALRVLHERSFIDDPTRLLRLARYASRLEFEPEQGTARLAAEAVEGGALASLSRARFGAELRLALAEPDPVAALAALEQLGALAALDPGMRLDQPLARAALALLPPDGRPEVLLLACLLLPVAATREQPERALRALLDELEFAAGEREAVVRSTIAASPLVERLERANTPSRLHQASGTGTLEAVALAAALGESQGRPQAAQAARRWISELRHVRLAITGEDLLGAGIAAGPEIGRRLERALRRKLDGELDGGREAELSAALENS